MTRYRHNDSLTSTLRKKTFAAATFARVRPKDLVLFGESAQ
jgi:hypothetical protein